MVGVYYNNDNAVNNILAQFSTGVGFTRGSMVDTCGVYRGG